MSYERPTIEEAIPGCWQIQDASNLSGVTLAVHKWVNVAREDAWKAGVEGDRASLHPVILCGICKMLHLAQQAVGHDIYFKATDLAYTWLFRWQNLPTGTDAYRADLKATIDLIWQAYNPEAPDGEA